MKRASIILILTIVFHGFFRPIPAHCLTVMTENFPPYNYIEDGQLKGPAVSLVQEIMRRQGLSEKIEILPWPRAYRIVQRQDGCALFSMARTVERENLFKWVGPLVKYNVSLFKKKGSEIHVRTLGEATNYVVGVKYDTAGYEWLASRGFQRIHIDYTHDHFPLPRLLDQGRIDLWLSSDQSVQYMARISGIDPAAFESTFVIFEAELYIAFSMSTPDSVVRAWQTQLDEIKSDGTYDRIMDIFKGGR